MILWGDVLIALKIFLEIFFAALNYGKTRGIFLAVFFGTRSRDGEFCNFEELN